MLVIKINKETGVDLLKLGTSHLNKYNIDDYYFIDYYIKSDYNKMIKKDINENGWSIVDKDWFIPKFENDSYLILTERSIDKYKSIIRTIRIDSLI